MLDHAAASVAILPAKGRDPRAMILRERRVAGLVVVAVLISQTGLLLMVGRLVFFVNPDFLLELSILFLELLVFNGELIDLLHLDAQTINFFNELGAAGLLQVGGLLEDFDQPVAVRVKVGAIFDFLQAKGLVVTQQLDELGAALFQVVESH